MVRREWTKEETLHLISLYESMPVLWNNSLGNYNDKNLKNNALNTIAEVFETTPMEINRKLHNLKGQFFQELKKVKTRNSSGTVMNNYVSTWSYYNDLKFLDFDNRIKTIEHVQSTNITKNESNVPINSSTRQYQSRNTSESSDHPAKKKKEEELLKTDAQILTPSTDEDQIFGDYVASSLRSLIDINNKRRLKLLIQKNIVEVF